MGISELSAFVVHALFDIIGPLFSWFCLVCFASSIRPVANYCGKNPLGQDGDCILCFRSFQGRFCFGGTILSMEVRTCEHILIDGAFVFWLSMKHRVQ